MKKIIAFLTIFLALSIFFSPFLLHNRLPLPSDSLVGLYHPFRDFYAKDYPRGMPFKNFLITDPVRQQYLWRFLSNTIEQSGQLPLWNPYNGLGMPLLANQQSAIFYPLNVLFLFLPFATAWSLQVFLVPLLGSLFLYLYLRELKISLPSIVFACIAFSFSAFMVVWLEWNTVTQSFIWLPFLLWSIEKLFTERLRKRKIIFIILTALGLTFSLFAGHLQTFFYIGVVSVSYFLLKLLSEKDKKQFALYFIAVYGLFLLLSSIQLIPTLQLIGLSARTVDMDWTKAGWFIPLEHLVQFFVPDFFGNPTTLNYWGVWNYAELVGYVGIIPFLFSCIGIFFVRRKITYFFLGVLIVSLIFATDNPIARIPFLLHIPFLSTSQPTRLLSLIDFSLILLAAFGMDYLKKITKKQALGTISLIGIVFLSIWGILLFGSKITSIISAENLSVAKRNSVFPTGLFLLSSCLLLATTFLKSKKVLSIIMCLFIGICFYDGLRFAQKFTPFTASQLLYPTTQTMKFLQQHLGDYRYMTTDDRILPPNVSAYYHVQSLDVYDPLYLQRYGEFIAALQRNEPSINPPFGFNRIVTPHTYNHPFINLMGVKYVLSLDSINDPGLKKVFEEGETKVYENTRVLSRVFFVKIILASSSKEQSIRQLYAEKDSLDKTAVVEGIQKNENVFAVGKASITHRTPSEVVAQTENNGGGFLVLSDAYYPTWHAFVDNKEAKIYSTDYILRGIFVPKGKHTIAFKVAVF